LQQGVNQRVRELRKEFFSKAEFENLQMKLVSKQDIDVFRKEMNN